MICKHRSWCPSLFLVYVGMCSVCRTIVAKVSCRYRARKWCCEDIVHESKLQDTFLMFVTFICRNNDVLKLYKNMMSMKRCADVAQEHLIYLQNISAVLYFPSNLCPIPVLLILWQLSFCVCFCF